MLSFLDPASSLAIGLLIFSLLLVMAFEATNGFHDAANAVATVIYTKSLGPAPAVVWSGFMNFAGVLIGGISVAYALVEILPPEVLSPPSGAPAVAPGSRTDPAGRDRDQRNRSSAGWRNGRGLAARG